jgi:catechol 2,3-dioxygenase-like lactoylglutathione lyase family enzyme
MKSIEIISIPVTDQARAKEFYLQLGFNLIVEAPFSGDQQWVQLGFPGSDVSITLVTWFDNMPAGCINGLVIKTGDLTKEIEELTAKGITVGKIDQTPWGKFAAVTDPDGNRLSLHEGR